MSRTLRSLAVLAMVALISVISAGCGSNAPSETGAASNSGTGGTKKATDRDKAVKFAECMRENGVSDFPDPNTAGEFVYREATPRPRVRGERGVSSAARVDLGPPKRARKGPPPVSAAHRLSASGAKKRRYRRRFTPDIDRDSTRGHHDHLVYRRHNPARYSTYN